MGASIISESKQIGAISNQFGYFSLRLRKSVVRVSYVGYQTKELDIDLQIDTLIKIELSVAELKEVMIRKGRRPDFIKAKLSIPIPLLKKYLRRYDG